MYESSRDVIKIWILIQYVGGRIYDSLIFNVSSAAAAEPRITLSRKEHDNTVSQTDTC